MQNNNIEESASLFCECFGDDMSVARELFSITDIHSIRINKDGQLAALCLLVPVNVQNSFGGFYVFGVCVRPAFRGRGLFSEIMRLCEEYAHKEGASLLCLIPATDALLGTYTKMGYSTRVSLADAKSEGDLIISSRSGAFYEYCNREAGELMALDIGLAKLLDTKYENATLAFDAFFGER